MKAVFLSIISLFFIPGRIVANTNKFFTQQDLFVSGCNNTANYRIPSLLVTTTGVVIAVCDARKDRAGDAPNNIDCVIRHSIDNGTTWSDVNVIADYPGARGAGDPALFYDRQAKTLWVAYTYADEGVGLAGGVNKPGYGDDTFHIYLQQSKDDGLTWSKQVDITRQIKPAELLACWSAPGIGIQLRPGRLVFCFSTLNVDRRQDSYVAYSDDNGQTWKSSRAGIGTNESQLVELNDGRLMIVMRMKPGKRLIAYSEDSGQTWTKQFESDVLVDPKCQASILRYSSIKDGDANDIILYSNPANSKKRLNLTVRASFDEGKTWPVAKTINADYSGYSCLTKLANGQIGLLYERNTYDKDNQKIHTITFARFNLEWLMYGSDCCAGK
jgi:sialidase-1